MKKKNNNIFLAGGDVLVYLAEPVHKKYSTTFVWAIHSVRTYFMTNFLTPSPSTHIYTFWTTILIPPASYVLNRWPDAQPKNK